MTTYIGIDPGLSGAIVAIAQDGTLLWCHDQPTLIVGKTSRTRDKNGVMRGGNPKKGIDIAAMANILRYHTENTVVVLENPGTRPGEGSVGAMSLGRTKGAWEGILAALKMQHMLVHPATWTKRVLAGSPGDNAKEQSVAFAKRRWPDLDLAHKKDHDRAQAACIAEWGRLTLALANDPSF